jgi:hypothetical protein
MTAKPEETELLLDCRRSGNYLVWRLESTRPLLPLLRSARENSFTILVKISQFGANYLARMSQKIPSPNTKKPNVISTRATIRRCRITALSDTETASWAETKPKIAFL